MGYYTCVFVKYRGKKYICGERDGFENWCEKAIKLIIDEFIIYKDYIKNILNFLNIDRSKNVNADFWPKWKLVKYTFFNADQFYIIDIHIDNITVHQAFGVTKQVKIQKVITPEFIEFINRRFLLKHICKKHNLPKDLHQHLINFF